MRRKADRWIQIALLLLCLMVGYNSVSVYDLDVRTETQIVALQETDIEHQMTLDEHSTNLEGSKMAAERGAKAVESLVMSTKELNNSINRLVVIVDGLSNDEGK